MLCCFGVCAFRFVIKLRSDEYFSNLTPLAIAIQQHPEKLISTNIYVMQSAGSLVSDHCFGTSTSNLAETSERLIDLIQTDERTEDFPGDGRHSTERLLLRSFIQTVKRRGSLLFESEVDVEAASMIGPINSSTYKCMNEKHGEVVDHWLVKDAFDAVRVVRYVAVSSMKPYKLKCNSRSGVHLRKTVTDQDEGVRVEHALLIIHQNPFETLLDHVVHQCAPSVRDRAHHDLFAALRSDDFISSGNNKMLLLQAWVESGLEELPGGLQLIAFLSLRLLRYFAETDQEKAMDAFIYYMQLYLSASGQPTGNLREIILSYLPTPPKQDPGSLVESAKEEEDHLSSQDIHKIILFMDTHNIKTV